MRLADVVVFRFGQGGHLDEWINADTALLDGSGNWHLRDGVVVDREREVKRATTYSIASTLDRHAINEGFTPAGMIPLWKLPQYVATLEQFGFSARVHAMQFHTLLSLPATLISMMLLGAAFMVPSLGRSAPWLRYSGTLLGGVLFYAVRDFCRSYGETTDIPVALAAWLPALLPAVFGCGGHAAPRGWMTMPGGRVRLAGCMVLLALCLPRTVAAESEIEADRFTVWEETSVVEASGNVRLRSGARTLTADRIEYRYAEGRIFAEGQVHLTDADGTVHAVERVELTDDLRSGAFRALRSQFAAGGVLSAGSARRTRGVRTDFRDVTYTRCESCPDSRDPPPWRVRATAATHETQQQTITYRDVLLEAFGVPVMYLPWARFKDFSVRRAKGFLLPAVRSDRALGLVVETPYFLPLGPSQDLLLRSGYATREGLLLGGAWRRAGISSDYRVEASATRGSRTRADGTRARELRGHLSAKGAIGLAKGWSVGWDATRASDASYLARYGLGRGINVLSQYGYLRKRGDRLNADLEVYGFQNLSILSEDDRVPFIFPRARLRWDSGPAVFGGRIVAVGDALALAQDDGRRNRRLSVEGRWERSFPRDAGYVLDTVVRLRADAFDVQAGESDEPISDRRITRFAPSAELGWRFSPGAPVRRRAGRGRASAPGARRS